MTTRVRYTQEQWIEGVTCVLAWLFVWIPMGLGAVVLLVALVWPGS